MGEVESKVRFSETGSQTVIQSFRNVGSAAGTSAQQVTQGTSAVKQFGTGVKSTAANIGQAASAFATLSLSVVSTYRAYRDLGDAQLAVDKAQIRLTNATQKLNDLKEKAKKIQQEETKGGIVHKGLLLEVEVAHKKWQEAMKKTGKNSLEARVAQQKYDEAIKKSKEGGGEYAKILREIADQEGIVQYQTEQLGEAQERFNDTQQNFYLSLLPTALSSFGLLSTAIGGVTKSIGGGGAGLIGGLGPLGIALGAGALAVMAYQNNWLGLKDAVSGVVDWVKARAGDWQKTFQEIFGFIQKGDIGGAFERIKQAAIAFWNDLVHTVPFFGGVNKLIDAIRNGRWGDAFAMIQTAALQFWEDLKAKIPFFAGAETFFRQLFSGDFAGAFNTLKAGLETGWAAIVQAVPMLGDFANFLRTKWEMATETAKSIFNQLKDDLTGTGGAFTMMQQGLAAIGSGDVTGGMGQLLSGLNEGIVKVKNAINNWVLTNFGLDLSVVESQAKDVGMKIMGWIGNALTFVSTEWIDPALAQIFSADAWNSALTAVWGSIQGVANAVFGFLGGAILGVIKGEGGGAGAMQWLGDVGQAIYEGIITWMETNLPDTTRAIRTFANGFIDAIRSTGRYFQIGGMEVWNQFIAGIKEGLLNLGTGPMNPITDILLKALHITPEQIKNTENFKKAFTFDIQAELDKQKVEDSLIDLRRRMDEEQRKPPVKMPIDANTNPMSTTVRSTKNAIAAQPPAKVKIDANTQLAMQAKEQLVRNIANTVATMQIRIAPPKIGGSTRIQGSRFSSAQGGMHINRLREDRMIFAHKNEYVHIDKTSKGGNTGAGKGGGGGGGFGGPVEILIGEASFKGYIRSAVAEDQGTGY